MAINVFPSHPNSRRPPHSGRGARAPSFLCSSPALVFLCAVAGRPGWARQAELSPLTGSPPCPRPLKGSEGALVRPLHTCPPGPGRGMGSCRAMSPGPPVRTLRPSVPPVRVRPSLPHHARGGLGALGAGSAPPGPPGPSPGAHKGSPSPPSPDAAPFRGRLHLSRQPGGGPGGNKGAAVRGQRGRGAGAGAHQSAALSSRITSSYAASSSRRWPLKLTPAMLRAGPRPNGQMHGRTDGGGEREGGSHSRRRRRFGASAALRAERASGRGKGAGREGRGAGGAGSARLVPPRSVLAPPQPGPGGGPPPLPGLPRRRPAPLTQRPCAREDLSLRSRGLSHPRPKSSPTMASA